MKGAFSVLRFCMESMPWMHVLIVFPLCNSLHDTIED